MANILAAEETRRLPCPLARAAAVGGDEYASHVAATGAFVRNQALVLGSRCDAQQLVHRVRAARARHAAIRSGLSIDSEMNSFASGTIASARTSSPSMPGTQPVSSNISLAVSTRALTLLMIGSPVLVQ